MSKKFTIFLILSLFVILGFGCNGLVQDDKNDIGDNVDASTIMPVPSPDNQGNFNLNEMIVEPSADSGQPTDSGDSITTDPAPDPVSEVKTFNITAKRFNFTPSTITVNQGDTIILNITSTDVAHGFAISGYSINVRVEPGTTETVRFVADKKGSFTFRCSVICGSGHGGMRGTLIVQ